MKLPITYLFVPGNRPERFDKALGAGADAVVIDCEDAVAPRDKDSARANALMWAKAQEGALGRIVVRINAATTPWFAADLDLLRQAGVRTVMLPKAETSAEVALVRAALPSGGAVLPLIESARGLANVEAVAAAPGVARLVFGTLDYGVDLNLSGDDRGLIYPSSRIAVASRCAGIASPVAGVTPAIDDDARLLSDLAFARSFGFGAKVCIHPRQVAVIHKALQPTEAEIDWARRVLAAAGGGEGVVQVEGKMVDLPVVLKARTILDRTEAN